MPRLGERGAAQTFRANPKLKVEAVITEMGVGEALVSFLDEKGIPGMVERAMVCPPHSQIGPITPEQREALIKSSVVAGVYETVVDRESAYEKLKGKVDASGAAAPAAAGAGSGGAGWASGAGNMLSGVLNAGRGTSGRGDSLMESMAKSAARTMGSTVGRQIIRGVLGSLLGGSSKR